MQKPNGRLVLKRHDGMLTNFTHRASGDSFRIRVYNIVLDETENIGSVSMAIEDFGNKFKVERPERLEKLRQRALRV
jgi:hypothetical protein